MTRYLDLPAVSALVQKIGLETVLSQLASYIVEDYARWTKFEKSARTANHSEKGVIELMPISDEALFGFKYVNGHPQNTVLGLPTVMAFGVLSEVDTGFPILLSELTLSTALRTAATSAVAARHLARKNSKIMALIGCGAQSEFQVLAFKSLVGINQIYAYDIDPDAIEKLKRNLASMKDLTVFAAASVKDAVKGADIITTLTADKARATILTLDMMEPGVHINAVGGDCPGKTEIHPDILRASRVVVEFEPQTRIEGDIQQMDPNFPVVELWKIVTHAEQGRQSSGQITVFDSVGFALEDFSVLRYLNDVATEQNAGTFLELIPTLANPKDLFAVLNSVSLALPPSLKAERISQTFKK